MNVQVSGVSDEAANNVVNLNTIKRVSPGLPTGAYLHFIDGKILEVKDSMKEILDVIMLAEAKEKSK